MELVKFIPTQIFSIKELENDKSYDFVKGTELIEEMSSVSYGKRISSKIDEIGPGIKPGSALGIMFQCVISGTEEDCSQFAIDIFNVFEETFAKENILSYKYQPLFIGDTNYTKVQVLVFPLQGRVLNSKVWLTDENECPLVYNKILTYLSNEFEKDANYQLGKINNVPEIDSSHLQKDKELFYKALDKYANYKTETSFDMLDKITEKVIERYTLGSESLYFVNAMTGELTMEKFLSTVEAYLRERYPKLSDNDIQFVRMKFVVAIYGNHVLEPLIEDDNISDIKVIAPDKIRVKCAGKRMTSDVSFYNREDYIRFIQSLAIKNNIDLRKSAIHVFTDSYTSNKFILRFNITTQMINSVPYPYLHIRKIKKNKLSLDDLVECNMYDEKIKNYLRDKIQSAGGIVLCGKGSSGKTVLLNALIEEIPKSKAGLVIQESEELFSKHPDIMFQHVVEHGYNGLTYTLQDEARNGLLTDIDYFVIGEVKGGEAMYFINAAATGYKCWCTVHSASSESALDKLADYVMYESKYDKDQALYMLKDLDLIIFLKEFKIYEIIEIKDWDPVNHKFIFNQVFIR